MTFDAFSKWLVASLGIEPAIGLTRETGLFDELGLDSVQTFEMLIVIEQAADLLVPLPELPEIWTLGAAFDYYQLCVRASAEQAI